MSKAVGFYIRISTNNQNIDSQKVALIKYAEYHGILNYKFYVDVAISGAQKSRPELDNLIKDVELGLISSVVSYSLSRISRSAVHLLSVLELFTAHSTQFVSLTEQIQLNTPAGKLLVTVLGAVAELERSVIRERICSGLAAAKMNGVKLGKPKKPINKELLINLVNQKMSYREMSKLLGVSPATISRELQLFHYRELKNSETKTA